LGHNHLLRESAVALHTDHFAVETKRFLAARAILALAAENIGLNRDAITFLPILHPFAACKDGAGDFAAWRARQLNGKRQPALFEPKIEMIHAAGENLRDDFARRGPRVGQIANLETAWPSVRD